MPLTQNVFPCNKIYYSCSFPIYLREKNMLNDKISVSALADT